MIRKLAAVLILASSISFLAFNLSKDDSSNHDFIAYWAAGQLLIHNENPYDPQETFRLERSAGWLGPEALVIRNPPFCLPLTAPLSLVGARSGSIMWTLLVVGCIAAAVRILWALNGRPDSRVHLLSYVFAPTLCCILAGQSVAFVLIGLVLFFRFHQSYPFLAGLSLALPVTLKPHLFVVFGIAFLFWALANRRYRVASGAVAGAAALGLAATLLDPHCWSEYLTTMRAEHVENFKLPNLSVLFRIALDQNAAWLQLVPVAIASVWAFWYARRHRSDWDWMAHGSLLMLISVMVAPYSWFFDEVTLLPAVLHGLYAADRNGRSLGWFGLCDGAALIIAFSGLPINHFYYAWTPLAWLATYAYAMRSHEVAVAGPTVPTQLFEAHEYR